MEAPVGRSMAMEPGLRQLREKYRGFALRERPFFIDEWTWSIFAAYMRQEQAPRNSPEKRISSSRLRQLLYDVDAQLELPRRSDLEWEGITPQSPIEDLALSIRARNALHNIACRSVQDVLQLDISKPIPRVGGKTRSEILAALQGAGFPHPARDPGPGPNVASLARSLDRMQRRIDRALRSLSKEVSLVQRQLQDWLKE